MIVAPHAIIRYLERIEGFDVEGARQRLRPAALRTIGNAALVALLEQEEPALIARVSETMVRACADAAGSGAVSLVSAGVKYVFRGRAIVTVMRPGARIKKRKREREISM